MDCQKWNFELSILFHEADRWVPVYQSQNVTGQPFETGDRNRALLLSFNVGGELHPEYIPT